MKEDMKRIRHSKFKNTGLIFELLVRQTTADVLNESQDSISINLIKKYFGKNKPLSRELNLYKGLMETKFNSEDKAKDFINETIHARARINNTTLKKEKYNLIKDIKENYDIEEFFRNKLNTYKDLASIYKLFEVEMNEGDLPPKESVQCKHTLIERITGKVPEVLSNKSISEDYRKQTEDVRMLAYKMMIDKFNEKYSDLNESQKNLLREYIYNVSNTNSFRKYVDIEIDKLKKELKTIVPKIADKSTKIKVKGIIEQVDTLKRGKVVRDDQLVQLMRYYELVKEIKKINCSKEKVNG